VKMMEAETIDAAPMLVGGPMSEEADEGGTTGPSGEKKT
jgi:hypothetical protein